MAVTGTFNSGSDGSVDLCQQINFHSDTIEKAAAQRLFYFPHCVHKGCPQRCRAFKSADECGWSFSGPRKTQTTQKVLNTKFESRDFNQTGLLFALFAFFADYSLHGYLRLSVSICGPVKHMMDTRGNQQRSAGFFLPAGDQGHPVASVFLGMVNGFISRFV